MNARRARGPKRVLPLLLATLLLAAGTALSSEAAAQTFSVSGFTVDTLHSGAGTTAVAFGPTGIMYLAEKRGRLLALTPNGSGGFNTAQVFADLRSVVDSQLEAGMLGLVVDPEYASNRYIYALYTTSTDQRVVRFTANAAGTASSAQTTLLSGLPRSAAFHKAGDMEFRPGEVDHLYIALGDDGVPADAQSLTSLRGKILRVSKANGEGSSTNPYYAGGSLTDARSMLWAIGLRNPFRFAFHPTVNQPASDVLYVSENGDSTDKLSWVRAGSNGSWSPAGDSGGFLNPPDTNHRVMYTDPASHIGITVAASGPFAAGGYPTLYLSNWVYPTGGAIRRWRLTGADLDTATAIAADGGAPFVRQVFGMDLEFGPDGSMYFTTTGQDASPTGFDMGRIRYVAGQPPVAAFTASATSGPAPLAVTFTDGSSDPDGTLVSWSWSFGDGSTSTLADPTHTYTTPGSYTVTVTVTDDTGLTATASETISVVAGFTLVLDGEILDGRYLDGRRVTGTHQIRLYRADGSTPIALSGGLGPDENGLSVIDGDIDASLAVQVPDTAVVLTVGETSSTFVVHRTGFDVPAGQTSHTEVLELVLAETAIAGQISDTRGDPVQTDVGVALDDIADLYALAGGRDYLSSSGIAATGYLHRRVSDPLGYYHLPLRTAGHYYLDVVGDTNSATYVSTLLDRTLSSGQRLDLDITVGLQAGGASCDDLASVPATANVDYATQIQPLWTFSCTGCHRANSGNGGGLDLTTGTSWAAMVGVASTQVPGLAMVQAGQPEQSYLMEKISCENPQVGNRMRPGSPMTLAEQALVRDWIAQGALAALPTPDAGVPDLGPADLGPDDQGVDSATFDLGDAGPSDVGADVGAGDAGTPDGSLGDMGPTEDASTRDGGLRTIGAVEPVEGGCTCAARCTPDLRMLAFGLLGLAATFGRRRARFSRAAKV